MSQLSAARWMAPLLVAIVVGKKCNGTAIRVRISSRKLGQDSPNMSACMQMTSLSTSYSVCFNFTVVICIFMQSNCVHVKSLSVRLAVVACEVRRLSIQSPVCSVCVLLLSIYKHSLNRIIKEEA